jgi:hypothetical protein
MEGSWQEHFDSPAEGRGGRAEVVCAVPLRGGAERDSSGDDVHPLISKMVGYFSSELLEVVIRAVVEVDAERVLHTKA